LSLDYPEVSGRGSEFTLLPYWFLVGDGLSSLGVLVNDPAGKRGGLAAYAVPKGCGGIIGSDAA